MKHFDNSGNCTGESFETGFGETLHFDNGGQCLGTSLSTGFGETVHYDNGGHCVGTTLNTGFGYAHFDNGGQNLGSSWGGLGSWNSSAESDRSIAGDPFHFFGENNDDPLSGNSFPDEQDF